MTIFFIKTNYTITPLLIIINYEKKNVKFCISKLVKRQISSLNKKNYYILLLAIN